MVSPRILTGMTTVVLMENFGDLADDGKSSSIMTGTCALMKKNLI